VHGVRVKKQIHMTSVEYRESLKKKTSHTKKQFNKEKNRSNYEVAFSQLWRATVKDSLPVEEYQFSEDRRWRFDFAFPDEKLAVELDGGQWMPGGGRHNTDDDREKINAATILGWCVIRFSGTQFMSDPIGCIEIVKRALEARRIN